MIEFVSAGNLTCNEVDMVSRWLGSGHEKR